MDQDEELLLALLNSAPIVDGAKTDQLEGAAGEQFSSRFDGTGTTRELRNLQRTRNTLQDVVRGQSDAGDVLRALLDHAVLTPAVTSEGIQWELQAPPDERLSVRAAIAWSRVVNERPGRLRACANSECNLFLVDHSRPGTAKWCSMATCGNRVKVRAHASRRRQA